MVANASNNIFIRIQQAKDVSIARRQGMDRALEMGFNQADATKIAVAISELSRNIFIYASSGSITILSQTDSKGRSYIKIIATDNGPGIANVKQAMSDGFTTSGGLGLGISGSKRLMDDFVINSAPGKGTTITAIKWL